VWVGHKGVSAMSFGFFQKYACAKYLICTLWISGAMTMLTALATDSLAAKPVVSEEYMNATQERISRLFLKNGISVTHYQNDSDMMALIFDLDWSRDDYLYGWGLHRQFIAALMTQQTQRFGRDELADKITNIAQTIRCGPTPSCLNDNVHLTCSIYAPHKYLTENLEVLHSIITEPKFSSQDLEVRKKNALLSIQSCANKDRWQLNKSLHALRFTPSGFNDYYYNLAAQVKRLTTDDLTKEYQKFLNARRMNFAVVSPDKATNIQKTLNKTFGSIPSWHYESHIQYLEHFLKHSSYDQRRVVYHPKDLSNIFVKISFSTPGGYSTHQEAWRLLMNVMYINFFEQLRSHKGLSYAPSVSSGVISFTTSKLKESMDVVRDFIKSMREDPLHGKGLQEYTNAFYTEYFRSQSNTFEIAQYLHGYSYPFYRIDTWSFFPKLIAEVDVKTLRFLAQYYLRNFKIAILGPQKLVGDTSLYNDYFDPEVVVSYP